MSQLTRINKILKFLNTKTKNFKPDTILITGSGLANAIPKLSNQIKIPYAKIPGFPKSTVKGHTGNLIFGTYGKKKIVVMQGRFHYYEGHPIQDLAIPIRVLWKMGAKTLIVSAAVGSFNEKLKPGSMAILKDHINFMGINPLIGNYIKGFGNMFFDISNTYDKNLRTKAKKIAKSQGISHAEAIYVAFAGPNFDTPTEIQMFKKAGADIAGMSVVPETLVAKQLDMKIVGFCWVGNMAAGITKSKITHDKVVTECKNTEQKFKKFLEHFLK
ncbi:MAG: purine-nucleoside phosphorylase [Elusimicrobiaceae bacterium]|nr:purine-nucleoside phosphorylase [Elusimicrobiaceae bacterium]MBT3955072.1 purine-nucleoside phosphorylase [Elusimicrobiaceae bacterium]MBT4007985.1 purine-nucleoside phosphorylase [Elusimicrobiaceae bacterium]MBT4402894.1 purine-nucleoside phosphorylase [Elusimicrobiaceae bacterium]MBT4439477.1 purine-nucleoside phosphorylase [Elusimicrobiaceae bacterium]